MKPMLEREMRWAWVACGIAGALCLVVPFAVSDSEAQEQVQAQRPIGDPGGMPLKTRIAEQADHGDALCRSLTRHRFWTQLIGMVSIFVTAMWWMYQNLYVGPFG